MKVIVLLSVLGLAVGCGTDVNHARTLASEEEIEQTKKDNRALKIAGITAGVALAGCVIVGVVKKKCISFAKKVARNVEDGTTTKSVDPSRKAASESAGVSGAKPKQGDEPDLDNVQKEAKASEVKEQEVQTTAESSSAKPKQSDEPDLEDIKEAIKEAMKDSRVKYSVSRMAEDLGVGVHGNGRDHVLKTMEDAGIPVSLETFEKMRKNIENGSVFLSWQQLAAHISVGRDVLTNDMITRLTAADFVWHSKIDPDYIKLTNRAFEIADRGGFPNARHHRLAARQLVEEGILTDEVAEKAIKSAAARDPVNAANPPRWVPVTEVFK